MNILFLVFLGFLLASVGVIYFVVKRIIALRITKRDFYVGVAALVWTFIISGTIYTGYELNTNLSQKFVISNEMESKVDFMDPKINDAILYKMISDLRIPHKKIVFAQAHLESATYTSDLYKSNFNLFGMKFATQRPTVTTDERRGYQLYANWKESVIDLLIWQFTNNVDKLTDAEYMQYLDKRYAEDPKYMIKLKDIVAKTNYENLLKN